jgi:phospholipid/cholesterol/gamma-HCH transport system permease protein
MNVAAPAYPPQLDDELGAPRRPPRTPEGVLESGGAIAALTWQALRELPHAGRHHTSELVRQAGLLAVSSLGVILMISLFSGGECGVQCEIISRQFGAQAIVASPVVLCTIRIISVLVFGYVIAAKVGSSLTAELGAMKVHNEVDAMESMGVRSVAFLVSSRLLASLIVLPVLLLLSLTFSVLGAFLVTAVLHHTVATGTWIYTFFTFLDASDILKAFVTGMAMIVVVVSVALYFGYTVRGGPVEVGLATARSMALNIVLVTCITTVSTLVFYGLGDQLPIA